MRADVFCRVVDNYGDIGVCWRLAQRLACGHGWRVRLWVDALASFARLQPAVDAARARQTVPVANGVGVEVVHWTPALPLADLTPGDRVIEAFGCDPPAGFIARMRPGRQVWVNLEYLSAEPWVESCHGLPSPQPGGLTKYFFFPGFGRQTGGLLREPMLLPMRDAWQADLAARDALLARLGLPASLSVRLRQGVRLVMLFCYPNAPIHALLDGLSQAGPAVLLVPDGVAAGLAAGRHGQVHIVRIPFVSQADFDRLLWSADLNLVRGEDSFVRALWAGRPMLWHIYPQTGDVHLDKLDAWLARYQAPDPVAALMRHWNGVATDALPHTLTDALAPSVWRDWQTHARAVSLALAAPPDLADALVDFCACIDNSPR